jgi:hypothetical protein
VLGKDYINKVDFDSAVYSPCGKDTVLNFGSDVRVNNANNKNGFGAIGTDSIQFRQVSLGSELSFSDRDSADTPADPPLELEDLLIFNCTSIPGAAVNLIFYDLLSCIQTKNKRDSNQNGQDNGTGKVESTAILRS